MSDVKWIKLYIDMFDKRKIKKLRRLPEGDKLLLIWIMFLVTAGKCNAGGRLYITESIPFTDEDLTDELGFDDEDEDDIKLITSAKEAFVNLDMIAVDSQGFIDIIGWEEYQNEDKLAEIREKDRERKRQKRAEKKASAECPRNVRGLSTDCPCIEGEGEEEKEKDIEVGRKDLKRQNILKSTVPPPNPNDLKKIICDKFIDKNVDVNYYLSVLERQQRKRIVTQPEEYLCRMIETDIKNGKVRTVRCGETGSKEKVEDFEKFNATLLYGEEVI